MGGEGEPPEVPEIKAKIRSHIQSKVILVIYGPEK